MADHLGTRPHPLRRARWVLALTLTTAGLLAACDDPGGVPATSASGPKSASATRPLGAPSAAASTTAPPAKPPTAAPASSSSSGSADPSSSASAPGGALTEGFATCHSDAPAFDVLLPACPKPTESTLEAKSKKETWTEMAAALGESAGGPATYSVMWRALDGGRTLAEVVSDSSETWKKTKTFEIASDKPAKVAGLDGHEFVVRSKDGQIQQWFFATPKHVFKVTAIDKNAERAQAFLASLKLAAAP